MLRSRCLLLVLSFLIHACSDSDSNNPDQGLLDARPEAESLELTVVPESGMDSFVGGNALFLVQIATVPQHAHVDFTVTADQSAPVTIHPAAAASGGVKEISLQPDASLSGKTVTLTLQASSGDLVREQDLTVTVFTAQRWSPPDPIDDIRDDFVAFLAENQPSLGIDSQTTWQWWAADAGNLVVANHLYLSDEWEMGIANHVTRAPDDWALAYLRRRSELVPSWAARMKSVKSDRTITEEAPPEAVIH